MMYVEIIGCMVFMAVVARLCGGGIVNLPAGVDKIPKIVFGAAFGLASYHMHGCWWLAVLATISSAFWMNTGHGTAYEMGYDPAIAQSGRKEFLSPLIDPITKAVRQPMGVLFYCVAFMGLKGSLIGLSVQPFGLILGFLWPLAYWFGKKMKQEGYIWDWQELISGWYAGLIVGLILVT